MRQKIARAGCLNYYGWKFMSACHVLKYLLCWGKAVTNLRVFRNKIFASSWKLFAYFMRNFAIFEVNIAPLHRWNILFMNATMRYSTFQIQCAARHSDANTLVAPWQIHKTRDPTLLCISLNETLHKIQYLRWCNCRIAYLGLRHPRHPVILNVLHQKLINVIPQKLRWFFVSIWRIFCENFKGWCRVWSPSKW